MIDFVCAQILLFALAFLGVLIPFYGGSWRLERGPETWARSRAPPAEQRCTSQVQATSVVGQQESREKAWVLDVQEWGRGIAAGVLLSAALVHILPSSTLQLKEGLAAVGGGGLETALTALGTSILIGILGVYSLDLQVRRYSKTPEYKFSTQEEIKEADSHTIPLLVGSHRTEPSNQTIGTWPLPDQTRSLQPNAYQDIDCLVSDRRQYATESLIWRVLLCSLSFHALSEGFALGLSQSNVFLMLYLAIIFHKFFAGFALGVSIACANVPFRRQLGAAALFAAATPSAATLARLLANLGRLSDRSKAVMQIGGGLVNGLAAGTFLAISLLEILPAPANVSSRFQAASPLGTAQRERALCSMSMHSYGVSATLSREDQAQIGAVNRVHKEEAGSRRALLPLLLSATGFSLLAFWI